MARTAFEAPEVCQLSERLADEVGRIVGGWDPFAKRTVGAQIVRSVDSVGANLAEGSGSHADHRRFVRGSLYETKHWLRRAHRRGLFTDAQTDTLRPLLDELAPRLNAYLNSIGRSRKPSSTD